MKPPIIHIKDSFATNAEFLCFALTHPTIDINRMHWEFADACYLKYKEDVEAVLAIHSQVHLICDDVRVAATFANRYETNDIKPQKMRFKADFTIG
jgi:hypothetical protein